MIEEEILGEDKEKALPKPEKAIVWSPVTKRWYDNRGEPIYS